MTDPIASLGFFSVEPRNGWTSANSVPCLYIVINSNRSYMSMPQVHNSIIICYKYYSPSSDYVAHTIWLKLMSPHIYAIKMSTLHGITTVDASKPPMRCKINYHDLHGTNRIQRWEWVKLARSSSTYDDSLYWCTPRQISHLGRQTLHLGRPRWLARLPLYQCI